MGYQAASTMTAEPALNEAADCGASPVEDPIEAIHRLHGKALYHFLLRVTLGDRREAEDLLQETLFRAWLYTVARRVSIDAARARQARPAEVTVTDVGALPAPRDEIDRMLVTLAVRHGLMSLSQDHRRVLIEVFYRGRSAREAAEELGIPEGTAKSRTHYALRALALATDGLAAG
jgi:RNA polymerase sigma-70 factor (ECF subfamily)